MLFRSNTFGEGGEPLEAAAAVSLFLSTPTVTLGVLWPRPLSTLSRRDLLVSAAEREQEGDRNLRRPGLRSNARTSMLGAPIPARCNVEDFEALSEFSLDSVHGRSSNSVPERTPPTSKTAVFRSLEVLQLTDRKSTRLNSSH